MTILKATPITHPSPETRAHIEAALTDYTAAQRELILWCADSPMRGEMFSTLVDAVERAKAFDDGRNKDARNVAKWIAQELEVGNGN